MAVVAVVQAEHPFEQLADLAAAATELSQTRMAVVLALQTQAEAEVHEEKAAQAL